MADQRHGRKMPAGTLGRPTTESTTPKQIFAQRGSRHTLGRRVDRPNGVPRRISDEQPIAVASALTMAMADCRGGRPIPRLDPERHDPVDGS
jgi:hypothetical protein